MADRKTPLDQAVDLFMYAPLGFVLEAPVLVPKLIERGRAQVKMARVLGRFAVEQGEVRAGKQLSKLQEQAAATLAGLGLAFSQPEQAVADAEEMADAVASAATADDLSWATKRTAPADVAVERVTPVVEPVEVEPLLAPVPDPSLLAIPDYDSLAASQVIPRLGGLSGDELESVRAYEAAGRGRKTILNKIAQLQAS